MATFDALFKIRREMLRIIIFFNLLCIVMCAKKNTTAVNSTVTVTTIKPNTTARIKITYPPHIQKQFKKLIYKPNLPLDRTRPPFHPAWMDYCDPYHCNDYHREVCGLNRRNMKFRYFQSGCHLILNNMCATYRGFLKYDIIELKFCHQYVMFLRMNCPSDCSEESVDPVCAYSTTQGHIVLFINKCSLDAANCRNNQQEYEEMKLSKCEQLLLQQKSKLTSSSNEVAVP